VTKLRLSVYVFALGSIFIVDAFSASTRTRILSQQANLRAAPSRQADIVATVAGGDILTCLSVEDGWIKVVPPQDVDLWIYAELLRDDVVAASAVCVRSGPGIKFQSVGELRKGDVVEKRGIKGDWLRIAPPKNCVFWVGAEHIEELPSPKPAAKVIEKRLEPPAEKRPVARPVVKKPAARRSVPPVPVRKPTPKPMRTPILVSKQPSVSAVPSVKKPDRAAESKSAPTASIKDNAFQIGKRRLVSSAPQGRQIEVTGVLHRSGLLWKRGVNYRLVGKGVGRSGSICYVAGGGDLSGHVGQNLVIRGRKYWLQGLKLPVVVPSSATPSVAR